MTVFTSPWISGAECDSGPDNRTHNFNAYGWGGIDPKKYKLANVVFDVEGGFTDHKKVELTRINTDNGDFQCKSSCYTGWDDGKYVNSGTVKFRCILHFTP